MDTKIGVISFWIGDEYKRQTRIGHATTKDYCEHHGYDYLVYESCPYDTGHKHLAWGKLLAIKDNLDKYDWLFWLDTDTLILDQSKRLEEWLDTDKDFVFSHDPYSTVNSGCWFVRNTDFAKQKLDDWYSGQEGPKWWEQWAINADLPLGRIEIKDNLSGILRIGSGNPRSKCFDINKHWIFHAAGRNKRGKDITPLMVYWSQYIRLPAA